MSKNSHDKLVKTRTLRMEQLENRELLSVSPYTTTTDELVASAELAPAMIDAPIDLSDAVAETADGAVAAAAPTTITVNSLKDVQTWSTTDSEVTLREALDRVADGGTIKFSVSGTIKLTNATALKTDKTVAIDASSQLGSDGAPGVTINAQNASRVLRVGANTTVKGVTFANGASDAEGGAIRVAANVTLTMENCVVKNSASGSFGGGIAVQGGAKLSLTNSQILSNTSASYGGGVGYNPDASQSGSITITNSTIQSNTASLAGGGVYSGAKSSLNITGSKIASNKAVNYGGGVLVQGNTATITTTSVYSNSVTNASGAGAGVVIRGGAQNVVINRSSIYNNTAAGISGGLYIHGSGTSCTVANSYLYGNKATHGAAIFTDAASANLRNVTVARNTSTGTSDDARAAYFRNSSVEIYNSIIAQNTGKNNADVADANSTVKACNTLSNYVNWDAGTGNLPVLSSKELFASSTDLKLSTKSQAINKGDSNKVYGTVDYDGRQRVQSTAVDLGASETSYPTPAPVVGSVSVSYSQQKQSASLTWTAIDGAATYKVYNNSTLIGTVTTNGLSNVSMANGSSNSFKVVAVACTGTLLDDYDTTVYAPVKLTSNVTSFKTGDTITVTKTSADAAANIKWYYVTPNGDQEIAAASGKTSFTAGENNYNIKVVANGTGTASSGSSYTLTFTRVPTSRSFDLEKGGPTIFVPGDNLTVSTNPADATVSIKWYEGGSELTEYRNKYSITAPEGSYDVTVVATGTGNYEGSKSVTFERKVKETPSTIVTSTADVVDPYDGVVTLREALAEYAYDNATITFASSLKGKTITLDSTITIENDVTIDAGALMTNDVPGVTIKSDGLRALSVSYETLEVIGLAFTGNETAIYAYHSGISVSLSDFYGNTGETGSAIYLILSDAFISNSYFHDNTAVVDNKGAMGQGGAIAIIGGNTEIFDSQFMNNTAEREGGAIYAYEANLDLQQAYIAENSAKYGGALHNSRSEVTIKDVAFCNNSAVYNGGAICALSETAVLKNNLNLLQIDDDSFFVGNAAGNSGGAVYALDNSYNYSANVDVADALFAENCAALNGGALYVQNINLTIDDTTLDSNVADAGGAIYADDCFTYQKTYVNVTNSYLVSNVAQNGGAINLVDSYLNLEYSWVYDNTAVQGGGAINLENTFLWFNNTLVVENSALAGAAVYAESSCVNAHNSTIANNVSDPEFAAIVAVDKSDQGEMYSDTLAGSISLYNTILAENSGRDIDVMNQSDLFKIKSCYTLSSFDEWTETESAYLYNPAEPLFKDVENSDYGLAPRSQAIGMGHNGYAAAASDVDLTGAERIQNGVVDLGAMESPYAEAVVKPISVTNYNPATGSALLKWNKTTGAVSYSLQYSVDGQEWITLSENFANNYKQVNMIADNVEYFFRVIAVDANGGEFNDYYKDVFFHGSVAISEYDVAAGTAVLSWDEISGAESYNVSMTTDGVNWTTIGTAVAENALQLSGLAQGVEYAFKVNAVGKTGESLNSYCDGSVVTAVVGKTTVASYDADAQTALVKWDAIAGAAKYSLEVSADSGKTWTPVGAQTANKFKSVSGIAPGKTYQFRVAAYDASGAILDSYNEGVFNPIVLSSATTEFNAGDTITVKKTPGKATGTVKWYYVTPAGDVLIEHANKLTYVAESSRYDLKVVVTGTGDSAGSVASMTFAHVKAEPVVGTISVASYDSAAASVLLRWDAIANADKYSVQLSVDAGETWTTVGAQTTNRFKSVSGVAVGQTYFFRVVAVDAYGESLVDYNENAFAPLLANVSASEYRLGDTLSVSVLPADADYTVAWYYVTPNGDVLVPNAAGKLSYVPSNTENVYKAVVTGLGESAGCVQSFTFTPSKAVAVVGSVYASNYDSEAGTAILKWDTIANAATYTVKKMSDAGEWTTVATNVTNEYLSISGLVAGADYSFYISANDASGSLLNDYDEGVLYTSLLGTIVVSTYEADAHQGRLRWNPIDGAESYVVKISKDGGKTWTNLATNVTDTTYIVTGLYVGHSYDLRVYGKNAAGNILPSYDEYTFSPVAISTTNKYYDAGTTINIKKTAASNATVQIRWYVEMPNGDEEILEARNKLSYTPAEKLEYNIKVVSSGYGVSKNSRSEIIIAPAPDVYELSLLKYNSGSHQLILQWTEDPNAVSYKIVTKDPGATVWTTYAARVSNTSATINGIYPSHSYMFRVYARYADGSLSSNYSEGTFEPIKLVVNGKPYTTSTAKNVTLQAYNPANVTVNWYYITDAGDVEITEARNLTSYKLTSRDYELRVVATGYGPSAGFVSSVNIARPNGKITVASESGTTATLVWDAVPGAESYIVKRSVDGGETWITYKKGLAEPTCVASGLKSGTNYMFSVTAYEASGKAMLTSITGNVNRATTASAVVDDAFVDFFADDLFEEF